MNRKFTWHILDVDFIIIITIITKSRVRLTKLKSTGKDIASRDIGLMKQYNFKWFDADWSLIQNSSVMTNLIYQSGQF